MNPSSLSALELAALVPNYEHELQTLSGTGRAIVSQPGSSDRVTVQFQSTREGSLMRMRTGVGIEGGQILVDSDSLLVYNAVDKYAEKVSVSHHRLTSVGVLASQNLLTLFSYSVNPESIDRIYENTGTYIALLDDRAHVVISKNSGMVEEVFQQRADAPYSKIEYEGYAKIENFYLPRKITIFSRDGDSRVTFFVQNLTVNQPLPELSIQLPDDIPIKRP